MLTNEMITELAGWLFPKHPRSRDLNSPDWLRSPDGLEAVENAMIERGYTCGTIGYVNYNAYPWWSHMVSLKYGFKCASGETKAEAVLLAAYKSMKKELGDEGD